MRLDGLVLDANDQPAAGARVTLTGATLSSTVTDRGGSFVFDHLIAGPSELVARLDRQFGGPIRVNAAWVQSPVVIRLRSGAVVEVQVQTARGAPPPVAAQVELRGPNLIQERTDPTGKARLLGVPPGPATLVVKTEGFAAARKPLDVPQSLPGPLQVHVVLRRGVGIGGRVVDEAGEPIQAAQVTAIDAAALTHQADFESDSRATDSQGRFELPPLSRGSYRLAARHPDYQDAGSGLIPVDGSEPVEGVEITMSAGATLAGEVLSADARPAAWAVVKCSFRDPTSLFSSSLDGRAHRTASADEHGRFFLSGLPRAEVTLLAMSDSAVSEARSVAVGDRSAVEGIVLRLAGTQGISGMVVDQAGEPVHDAQVSAEADEVTRSSAEMKLRGGALTVTDGGGRFAFENLPTGSYRLYASRSLVTYQQKLRAGVLAKTGDAGLRLVISDASGVLAGRVVFAGGGNPGWFSVAFEHPPGIPVNSQDGSFEIGGMPVGDHTVFIHGRSFSDAQVNDVRIAAGRTTDIGTIQVERGRRISGIVVDSSDNPVAGAQVVTGLGVMSDGRRLLVESGAASDETLEVKTCATGPDGAFAFEGVGPGTRMLIADHPNEGRSEPVAVGQGYQAEDRLVLRLHGTSSVAGRVNRGGKPALGAAVTASTVGVGNYLVKVRADEHGEYAIERITPGQTIIRAELRAESSHSMLSGSADVDLVAGEHHRVDIDIPLGSVSLVVEVRAEHQARIDLAPVHLFEGDVDARTAAELNTLTEATQGFSTRAFWAPGRPARLEGLLPGRYSLCVVPLEGAVEDQAFVTWLKKNLPRIGTHCSALEVEASPLVQSVVVRVPGMKLWGE